MSSPRGEFELIAAVRARLAASGAPERSDRVAIASGDDAAVTVPGGATATSVDALVEGVHFRMPPFEPASVGHKALAVALSDLAAMGAAPGEAYVQLGLPDAFADAEALALADGLARVAAEHSVVVAGGDVTGAPALFVAVTVVGHAARSEDLITRAGARLGDALAVTGDLGGAAAGLALLEADGTGADIEPDTAGRLRRRQLEPQPQLRAGLALAAAGARAMIDLSDGLGGDAGHLASASGVRAELEVDRLPLQDGVREVAAWTGAEPLELALSGGEDYELLVALDPGALDGARARLAEAGVSLTVVGRVTEGEGVGLRGSGASALRPAGFDQRRSR